MIDALRRMSQISTLSTWALFGAGVALSVMQVGMVLVIWIGHWSPAMEKEQLKYIGIIAIMLALDLMAVIASLAKARVSAKGPGTMGFEIGSSGTDAPPAPQPPGQPGVKVTVESPQP